MPARGKPALARRLPVAGIPGMRVPALVDKADTGAGNRLIVQRGECLDRLSGNFSNNSGRTFQPDAQARFGREIKVFDAVHKLHSLSGKAPRLVEIDCKSRRLVFEYPRLHWSPLHKRAPRERFDEPILRGLKGLLYKAVDELYDHGVAYPVQQDAIFLVKQSAGQSRSAGQSYQWGILLGGWQLCTLRNQAGRTEWNIRRRAQLDQVDLIFHPLLAQARQELHNDYTHQPALDRATLHSVLAARSRHGDFADYHERFNYDDARLDCSCGRRKAPEHPFYCGGVPPRLRVRLAPSPAPSPAEPIPHAVGKGFEAFVEMTSEMPFFQRICPRH
ncbi:hypothetical protein Purlil1_14011 [Purpureocillium lilacinum]|uniref:Uncharacterized protein n=1 Tax=Purpureocillium lilacinum TaxID=33203 RepID=A0ABR0BCH0_PURLI|nr:hypothetical protein Purlil1_14011 [Purpureocillium lilacinum]